MIHTKSRRMEESYFASCVTWSSREGRRRSKSFWLYKSELEAKMFNCWISNSQEIRLCSINKWQIMQEKCADIQRSSTVIEISSLFSIILSDLTHGSSVRQFDLQHFNLSLQRGRTPVCSYCQTNTFCRWINWTRECIESVARSPIVWCLKYPLAIFAPCLIKLAFHLAWKLTPLDEWKKQNVERFELSFISMLLVPKTIVKLVALFANPKRRISRNWDQSS